MERSDWLTTDGLSYPAWMLVSAAHAVVTEGHSKRSACFSERSESVGDSNFPDNSSDLSDGQIGVNPRLLGAALLSGERFT
ncbi:hypothetical protein ACFSZP_18325, partial [Paraglaciecola agarilytica]